jgi:hypothetical protein
MPAIVELPYEFLAVLHLRAQEPTLSAEQLLLDAAAQRPPSRLRRVLTRQTRPLPVVRPGILLSGVGQ